MPTLFAIKNDSGLDPREWNALIGIVTAIVGNTLISFALNIQRYAHIRLGRDRLQRQKSWRSQRRGRKRVPGMPDYGTQIEAADERARMNKKAPAMDEEDELHQATYHDDDDVNGHDSHAEDDEHTPLKGTDTVRSSSNSTVRQQEQQGGDDEENIQTKSYLKSPYWWLGIILMTIGEAGNFIAYGFAPASIVSPLGVVALISNCIIAPLLLKERFRQRDFWGVLIAIGGAVSVVLSARMTDPRLGPDDIWEAISRWEFELYLGLTVLAIIVLMWASSKYGHKSIFIDLGLVGLFGGYTALSTKGVASLLTDTIWRALTFPIFYLLIFVLVVTAIFQIRYVNRALQRFDSTRVVPTQFVCFTLSVIIGSAVLYREFESTTAENVGKFIGGCALTFFGVWLITSGKRDNDNEERFDEETGEMEGIRLIDDEQDDGENGADTGGQSSSPQQLKPKREPSNTNVSQSQMGEIPRTPHRTRSAKSQVSEVFSVGSGISPFSESPHISSNGGQTLRPSPMASASEPYLPTETLAVDPVTPARKSSAVTPQAPTPQAGVASHTPRASISRLLPGPISSPLSSSLSAIVADQLRRGIDVNGSLRSLRKGQLRRMRSNILDAESATPDLAEEDSPSPDEPRSPLEDTKSRTRSMSGTLGDLFRRGSRSKATDKNRESHQGQRQETGDRA